VSEPVERVVVIGAGIGGLTTAAALARQGVDVTVLEAQVYPGGCAGTFYHQGYRFDSGATLAGGFNPGGPMERVAQAVGLSHWPARHENRVLEVHLPTGERVMRWGNSQRHETRRLAFGPGSEHFWHWQEETADAMWDLALRSPAWPPQTVGQLIDLVKKGVGWVREAPSERLSPGFLVDGFRSVSAHLPGGNEKLRLFVDAQLLIAAQTTSKYANALYGASALDLPRRGVVHFEGGIGSIANAFVEAIRQHGGKVLFRKEAKNIVLRGGRPVAVETGRGESIPADRVVVNLPPWNMPPLFGDEAPPRLRRLPARPRRGWGAFVLYLGVDEGAFACGLPLHHQVIAREPLGEGNSIFISISPEWDGSRAPGGSRAVTISTHTELDLWWDLHENDRQGYDRLKKTITERILEIGSRVIPNLKEASDLIMPGTPVTFARFTRRAWGWVGGYPQVNLFQSWGPRIRPGVWMVGDSIFPGQSVAAVALGGLRVAHDVWLSLLEKAPLRDVILSQGKVVSRSGVG
jgi:C-3',4' desaturase CrtD